MVTTNTNKQNKKSINNFHLGRLIVAEKLIKQAWENNSSLEALTSNYIAQNTIVNDRAQKDLTLLAKFNGVSQRLVNLIEGEKSHISYLIKARDGGYVHPSDKQTLHIHNYIVKQLYNK